MRKPRFLTTVLFLFFLSLALPTSAQQEIDKESTILIKEYTTDERFLNPLIDHIPESDTVPSPREILGYVVGTPKKLTYYADMIHDTAQATDEPAESATDR